MSWLPKKGKGQNLKILGWWKLFFPYISTDWDSSILIEQDWITEVILKAWLFSPQQSIQISIEKKGRKPNNMVARASNELRGKENEYSIYGILKEVLKIYSIQCYLCILLYTHHPHPHTINNHILCIWNSSLF